MMKSLDDLKKVRERALEQMRVREGKYSAKSGCSHGHLRDRRRSQER